MKISFTDLHVHSFYLLLDMVLDERCEDLWAVSKDRGRECVFCSLLCKVAYKLPNKTKFLSWPKLMLHKSKLFEMEIFGPYMKT